MPWRRVTHRQKYYACPALQVCNFHVAMKRRACRLQRRDFGWSDADQQLISLYCSKRSLLKLTRSVTFLTHLRVRTRLSHIILIEEGFLQKARQTVVVSVWGARSYAALIMCGLNVRYCVYGCCTFPFTYVGGG